MKRNLLCILIFLTFVSLSITFYTLESINGVQKAQNFETNKIDYPLIDIVFDEEKHLTVVIRDGLFTKNEKILVSQNIQCLQSNKEKLSVLTFPVGRGTTPLGIVYVFKNGELIKETPYTKINFENYDIKSGFQILCEDDVEKLIGCVLPTPI